VKSPVQADAGSGGVYFDGGSYVPPADGSVLPPTGDLGSGAAGSKTCAELDTCVMSCADTDTTCFNNCMVQGTADAQTKMNALEQCGNAAFSGSCATSCADPSAKACGDCISTACATQVQACLGNTTSPTAPPSTGTLSCVQIYDCYETCAGNDNACFDACFYKGSADAQAKADALEQCDHAAETGACKTQCVSWNQTCWTCLDQACGAQATACGF
jgi:hypothetical protein